MVSLWGEMLAVSETRPMHPRPATFIFPATALRLEAEVLDLTPSVRARGSELDLDSAPGVKVWCLGEEPRICTVPGRRSKPALTSRRKPGYRTIQIRDRQKHTQQNGQSELGCPKKPRLALYDISQTLQVFFLLTRLKRIRCKILWMASSPLPTVRLQGMKYVFQRGYVEFPSPSARLGSLWPPTIEPHKGMYITSGIPANVHQGFRCNIPRI